MTEISSPNQWRTHAACVRLLVLPTTTGGKHLPMSDPEFTGEINKPTYKLGPQEAAPEPKTEIAPNPKPEPDPIDTAKR